MSKTYIPKMMKDVHDLNKYLARYGSTIRLALGVIYPEAIPEYDAFVSAVIALDVARDTLIHLNP